MKRLCVVAGLVCLLCSGAWALDYRGVGNWADPNGWADGAPPSGAVEVKVRGEETILTLNTSTGDWGEAQRLRVYEGATLIVEEGAELLGAGWMRVGATNPGYVIQTGGLVQINNEKLGIGDSAGSDGHYTISGGTLTHAGDRGDLIVGARGGQGIFTVVGTGPVIEMGKLIVGDGAGASGTVEFQLTAEGVSPIILAGSPAIDALGDETTSALVVGSAGGAPRVDVILIDFDAGVVVTTVFDTVNGEPAVEGATVAVKDATGLYYYALTYVGGDTGNDIALLYDSFVPAPKVVYVTDSPDVDADGILDDQGWIDWLVAQGYNVDARRGYWVEPLDPNRIAELEAADVIIASRGLNTSNYDAAGEAAKWNALTTPIINFNAWLIRSNRWKWVNSTAATKDSGSPALMVLDPNHPVFASVELDPNGLVEILDPNVGSGHTSFINSMEVGNGTMIAQSLGVHVAPWIIEWATGVEYYAGAAEFAGGPRMTYMAGTQDVESAQGEFNLNEAGQQILRNMIAYLAPEAPVAIDVENASFELPGTVKQLGWEAVPGWSSDTAVVDSGVETDWGPTDGLWTGFLKGGDPSVWQLTHHVIGADDVYELKVDARITWLATTLRITLYYEDAGVRVPAALADVALADGMQEFVLTFAAQDVPESVGKPLGIEFDNVTVEGECWAGIDNVRLSLQ